MRRIDFDLVKKKVCELAIQANICLRPDIVTVLNRTRLEEKHSRAKKILEQIIENSAIAKKERLAICQDTGLPLVFVEIGKDVIAKGKGIDEAIQQGINLGYNRGNFRDSVIKDPLRLKSQKSFFGPALVHYEYNNSHKLKITVLPKGFGCENKSKLKMLLPTADLSEIKRFILDAVKGAGADACPPYVVGVGIGGSADYACLLAKKALLKKVKSQKSKVKTTNQNSKIYKLEKELLSEINKLNIGPMGLGGKTTALAVKVLTYPTHIAGLPVAVNISCHALRSATAIL